MFTVEFLLVTIVLVILLSFIIYKEAQHFNHIKNLEDRYFKERQEILDRLMSQDFVQFKQGQLASKIDNTTPSLEQYPEDYRILE